MPTYGVVCHCRACALRPGTANRYVSFAVAMKHVRLHGMAPSRRAQPAESPNKVQHLLFNFTMSYIPQIQ